MEFFYEIIIILIGKLEKKYVENYLNLLMNVNKNFIILINSLSGRGNKILFIYIYVIYIL